MGEAVIGRWATRAIAAVALAVLAGGVPLLLVAGFGWPLPFQAPSWDQIVVTLTSPPSQRLVGDVVALLGWATWASFLVSLATDLVWTARHGLHQPRARRPLHRFTHGLIAALITGSLTGITTAAAVAVTAPPPQIAADWADHQPGPPAVVTELAAGTHPQPQPATTAGVEPAAAVRRTALWTDPPPVIAGTTEPRMVPVQIADTDQRHTVRVQPGDTLWDLAAAWLDDPMRWPEIQALNQDRYPTQGGAHLQPGWVLVLPADATPPTGQLTRDEPSPAHDTRPAAGQPVYEVARGDWLWHIADRYLGDPRRYPEIAALNPAYAQKYPGWPDHIEPGDELVLPPDATDDGPRRHATGQASHAGDPPAAQPSPPPQPEPTPPPSPPDHGAATPSPSASPSGPPVNVTPSGSPEPDGVVPAPTTNPIPTEPAGESPPPAASTPPAAADPPDEQLDEPAGDPAGVDLPGGWVGIGLAAAIAAAAAWVWKRRRHRHRPPATGLPNPDADPDLQPLPPVVARLRGAVRRHAPELLEDTAPQVTVAEAAAAEQPPPAPPAGPSGPQLAGLGVPPPGGVGLTGPGAAAATRALLVASLSAGGPADPDAAGQVVIPAATLADLLGGQALTELAGTIPRLHVTAGIGPALTWLDEQILARIRTLGDYDLADLPSLRHNDPWHEPAPPLLLIAELPEPAWRARLSAAMHLGQAVDTHAVLLGAWPHGTTIEVAADGTTNHPDQHLSTLDVETTRQLLTVLAEAHTGQPPPGHSQAATPTPHEQPDQRAGSKSDTAPVPADQPPNPVPQPQHEPPARPATGQARVRVRVLGRAAVIDADGNPVGGLRATAVQLLVFLACHRDGADIPDVQEAIWPEATLRRAGQRLSTTVANLRWALRTAAGLSADEAGAWKPVVNTGGRYHLNPDCLQVDWWQVQDAAAKAAAASDPAVRRSALAQAVHAWGGLLYDNKYEWIDPYQQTCRQYGLSIHTRLAELVADTDPQQARELLEAAADTDPLNEQVAGLAMRAHARLGETTAIKQRLATLTQALDEIDVEVDDTTRELASKLIEQAAHQQRPPPAATS